MQNRGAEKVAEEGGGHRHCRPLFGYFSNGDVSQSASLQPVVIVVVPQKFSLKRVHKRLVIL